MNRRNVSYKVVAFLFQLTSVLIIPVVLSDSWFPNEVQSACVLNFTSFPYQPSGECIGSPKKTDKWGSYPTTLCCENALTVFSQALALQARVGGNIFIDHANWTLCNAPFQRQNSVSVASCNFNDLYHNDFLYDRSKCSRLSREKLQQYQTYQEASRLCGQFDSSSFNGACMSCSQAVVEARDYVLQEFKALGNDKEKAICGVVVVISLAAEIIDDHSSLEDFYSCISALDVLEPGYFKIKFSVAKAMLAILLTSIVLMLFVLLAKCLKNQHESEFSVMRKISKVVTWPGLYVFSKAEIERAIICVIENTFLGGGSAGMVFRGILPSGQVVAIKEMKKGIMCDSFIVEGETLSRIRHPNLVSPLGYCMEDEHQYLVYEYCSARNLAQHLLISNDSVLTWERRVKILRDCACALKYLHNYTDGPIVHRGIKLTSILVSERWEGKLTGFGLATKMGMDETKLFADVSGSIGYRDPEYLSSGRLTCASDIYSFGIVALQLLSGYKVMELDLCATDQLTRTAKDVTLGKRPLRDIQDRRLNVEINVVDFGCILDIAVLCVARSSTTRPTIDVVFEEMEEAWNNTLADMVPVHELDELSLGLFLVSKNFTHIKNETYQQPPSITVFTETCFR